MSGFGLAKFSKLVTIIRLSNVNQIGYCTSKEVIFDIRAEFTGVVLYKVNLINYYEREVSNVKEISSAISKSGVQILMTKTRIIFTVRHYMYQYGFYCK